MKKTEEGTKNISVSLYPSNIREAEVLVKKGYYNSTSELVRTLIDREYRVKIKDAKEELMKQLAEKEELIKSLESLVSETEAIKETWITKYADKRKHLDMYTLSSPAKYNDAMKAWVKSNKQDLEKAYPGMNQEEIFKALEETITVIKR